MQVSAYKAPAPSCVLGQGSANHSPGVKSCLPFSIYTDCSHFPEAVESRGKRMCQRACGLQSLKLSGRCLPGPCPSSPASELRSRGSGRGASGRPSPMTHMLSHLSLVKRRPALPPAQKAASSGLGFLPWLESNLLLCNTPKPVLPARPHP